MESTVASSYPIVVVVPSSSHDLCPRKCLLPISRGQVNRSQHHRHHNHNRHFQLLHRLIFLVLPFLLQTHHPLPSRLLSLLRPFALPQAFLDESLFQIHRFRICFCLLPHEAQDRTLCGGSWDVEKRLFLLLRSVMQLPVCSSRAYSFVVVQIAVGEEEVQCGWKVVDDGMLKVTRRCGSDVRLTFTKRWRSAVRAAGEPSFKISGESVAVLTVDSAVSVATFEAGSS
ncbi:hypothetical protein KC321_g22 [Hortaea werneckii]|nr:hypothetical protein KC321_g22 [Hortaea werneckii]